MIDSDFTEWKIWYAWRPILTKEGQRVWLDYVWYRQRHSDADCVEYYPTKNKVKTSVEG